MSCLGPKFGPDFGVVQVYDYVEKSPSVKIHRVTDPLFFKSKFNFTVFSQTVGEIVFVTVSFEVEKMRMFLVQSIVHW